MSHITINESIVHPEDTRLIEFQVMRDRVRVLLSSRHGRDDDVVVSLDWDQLPDVELIANRFDLETVRTFRVLVQRLGQIHANRYLYEALT